MARILIVEDDPFMRSLIATILTGAGHEVIAVANGAGALARLAQPAPELALIDLGLPDVSGLEVLKILRDNASWQSTPIMMLTASHDLQDIVAAKEANAQGYLSKPIVATALVEAVDDMLRQSDLIWLDQFTRARLAG